MKLVLEFVRNGAKVYFADNENGATSLRNRFKMAVMSCELHKLYESEIKEELDDLLYKVGHYMRGDVFIDTYAAYANSISDVEARLAFLKEKNNWVPDIIIYDTIDKFIPSSIADQKRDTRIRIQLVYDEAINLNKKLGTFAIAPSQVNRTAIGKKVFDIKDLSEDFGKAMNAHAIFAICATDAEIEQGIRRIVPVAQREGSRYKKGFECIVEVKEDIMQVKELNKDELLSKVKDD